MKFEWTKERPRTFPGDIIEVPSRGVWLVQAVVMETFFTDSCARPCLKAVKLTSPDGPPISFHWNYAQWTHPLGSPEEWL